MLSWTVAENRNGSSLTIAIALAQAGQVDIAHVGAVDPNDARRSRRTGAATARRARSCRRPSRRPARACCRPRPRGRCRCSAGRDAPSKVSPTPRELHPSRPVGQRRGRLGHRHRRLAVEDLEDACARCRRPLRRAEHVAERAHRRDQHQQVGVEGGERPRATSEPWMTSRPPDEQDRGQAEVGQEADQSACRGPGSGSRADAWSKTRGDRSAEAIELALLLRERLDHAHARDVLLGLGGQLGDPLLDLLDRRTRLVPVAVGDQRPRTAPGPARGAASPGCRRNIATPASTIVSADWAMKISP